MIDLRDFDQQQRPTRRDPDSFTLAPLDPDVADYIRASLCRQRYEREQVRNHTPPPATVGDA